MPKKPHFLRCLMFYKWYIPRVDLFNSLFKIVSFF
jgi:hypothetical protein